MLAMVNIMHQRSDELANGLQPTESLRLLLWIKWMFNSNVDLTMLKNSSSDK